MSVPMVATYRAGPPLSAAGAGQPNVNASVGNVQQHQHPPAPHQARNSLKPYSGIPRSRSSVAPIPLSPNSSTFPRRNPVPPPAIPQPTSPRYPQPATNDYTRQPIVPQKHTPSPPPPYMASPPPGYGGAPQYGTYMQPATQIRRNSSNATSTSSNSGGGVVRRSSNRASSASTTSPQFSYVMRLRAKVAVSWCDRGQAEDPRIIAAMRAAKERAEREVALPPSGAHHHAGARSIGAAGGAGPSATTQLQHQPDGSSSSFTSGVARKIRHHGGAPKASKYAGGNLVGAGVPMRLSANEVDDDDELPEDESAAQQGRDDDWGIDASFYGSASTSHRFDDTPLPQKVLQIHQHRRSDSGGRGGLAGMAAAGHPRLGLVVPPEGSPDSESPDATPVASSFAQREYFQQQRSAAGGLVEERRREEELKRRGSVDDRAMTMSGVRLYVANPDVDD